MWTKSTTEFYAYAAGLFSAGGHMSEARCTIVSKDPEIPRDLQTFFDGNIRAMPTGLGSAMTYHWHLTDKPAIQRFLQTIVPYLHEKRKAEARDILGDIYEKEKRNA